MRNKPRPYGLIGLELGMVIAALICLVPFYFVVANSFKSFAELMNDTAGLPQALNFANYRNAWESLNLPNAFKNSLMITVVSNLGLAIIASMAAYRIVRYPTLFNRILFSVLVVSMVVPFQAIMIPLIKVLNALHATNSVPGIVLCYFGLGVAFTTFLFHGFVKAIPKEIEESAVVDGCNPFGVFWRIVFPLLRPMTITVILLNSLWIWNDFLLPLIVLQNPDLRTVQLSINSLFGEHNNQWDLALAALVMGAAPVVAFFLVLQRHIVEGISAGAVKG